MPPIKSSEKQILKLTKDSVSIIPDIRQQPGSTTLYIADEIQQSGNYNLTKQDSTIAALAFNNNRSESDLSYFTERELAKFMPKSATILQGGKGSLKNAVSEVNIGLQLWKLCIILALVFLAAEIVLLRYYKPVKQVVSRQL
jgi:hypothetical protein